MNVNHIAIWTKHIEVLKLFYIKYFGVEANNKYRNPSRELESYFLTFDTGCRLELMKVPYLGEASHKLISGFAHISISVGSMGEVNELTNRLRHDGYVVDSEPRTTGDGYYESVVLDPDGNRIEITA